MTRPIAFDVTHLASRLPVDTTSGIEKVDLAYGQHLATAGLQQIVHYGLRGPRAHSPSGLRQLADLSAERWGATTPRSNSKFDAIYRRITGSSAPRPARAPAASALPSVASRAKRRLLQYQWRLRPGAVPVADGAIYLNAAQHAFEYPLFFKWLNDRPDVRPVFLVHDLLPLDFPEYFKPGYKALFERRTETILNHAAAVITTSNAVKHRVEREYARRGRDPVPIHVQHLPSPLADYSSRDLKDDRLVSANYFICLGTIEPRKNHLLLLHIWRRMIDERADPPKLVIIGKRGWENEQVLDILDRSVKLRPQVIECADLPDQDLATLLANARGLLMPSFAEGYGLPIAEALSLGVPVIAADIPVFLEISQGLAVLCHPLDGPSWIRAIQALDGRRTSCDDRSDFAGRITSPTPFVPPTWPGYFAGVRAFLDTI